MRHRSSESSHSGQSQAPGSKPHTPFFRKSSHSETHTACVGVAGLPTGADLRDSKDPDAPVILVWDDLSGHRGHRIRRATATRAGPRHVQHRPALVDAFLANTGLQLRTQ
ncbi:DUF397 domain-containing protein [Actinorugispora endophytica]|uniref:Uncharacterized protein DUF397 n=1 Tax=Actinorugispora endophytica TaxID=1605990 RepID=A0A4R6V3M1_9ACTN|nr:DUF397 domain-containing protein [Actinorugispora endophytica]TDQ53351.1 uncharacterized protein DUF397 [Actinorugispora endophytica]